MMSRQSQLLELITENGRMEVSRLAERLGVSQVTIRKDLIALEAKGILRREHGYALLYSGEDINSRLAYHYESKRRIAQAAAAVCAPAVIVVGEAAALALSAGEAPQQGDASADLHSETTPYPVGMQRSW